jgi:hypothetical protein
MKQSYGTLSGTINGLKREGYMPDFNKPDENLTCLQNSVPVSADDFEIDKVYRFEGESNPDNETILYPISSSKFKVKGLLVNGYGISSNNVSDATVAKLKTHSYQKI